MNNNDKNDNLETNIAFLTAISNYFESHEEPYVISDSNGAHAITNNKSKLTESNYISSLAGSLQSVAAHGGRQILGELTTDYCIPLISHIGKNKYVITTPFNGVNVSYITTFKLTKKDINSTDTIYSQTCDAAGRFISDELEKPKIKPTNNLTKLEEMEGTRNPLNDMKPYQTSTLLANISTIHAARDGSLNEAKISVADDATLYIPVIKNGKYYLIISEKIPLNGTYNIKTKIKLLKDSKIYNFWENQEIYKSICDIAKNAENSKNN